MRRFVVAICFVFVSVVLCAQDVRRTITAVTGAPNGDALLVAMEDESGSDTGPNLLMISTSTGKVLWQMRREVTLGPVTFAPRIASAVFAPDGDSVAVGYSGVPDSDAGVVIAKAQSGEQMAALGYDEKIDFIPGTTYPMWGDGVSALAYSPDGSLLYGLSNDTLFAWDVAAKRYLWTKDVPAVIEAPPDLPHPLPYGHATTFALSPDGKQIAAARDALRIAAAGREKPGHFIRRSTEDGLDPPSQVAFSPDGFVLAVGELDRNPGYYKPKYLMEFWMNGGLKAQKVPGCGGGIAWSDDNDVFACQSADGAHLRSVKELMKNVGAAGPVSDLPIFRMGKLLWVAAYREFDWKDAEKPLPLTLVELDTGKRVTVTVPGRVVKAQ